MENTVQRLKIRETDKSADTIQQVLICFYFLISFFEPYLNGNLGAVTKYYILFLMGVLCIFNKLLRIKPFHWCFLAWLAFKSLSVLWTTNTYTPSQHIFSQIGMVGLLIILTAIPLNKKTINAIVDTMWLGSASIGILSLFLSRPYHGIVVNRQVLYLFGQEADPNNQAAFLLIGLAIALYYLTVKNSRRLLSIGTIVVNAFSMFMTGSRGGLVGLVCIAIVLLVISPHGKSVWSKVKMIVLCAAVVGVLYYIAAHFLPEDIFVRLFSFSSYEGGSEREVLWENGWQLFTSDSNFMFGAGWGAYIGYNGISLGLHNTFLSMLCDVGLFGFLLFFTPIVKTGIQLIKRKEILPVLLLICGFAPSFFIDAINKRIFWNAIFFLFIVYSNDPLKDKTDSNKKQSE